MADIGQDMASVFATWGREKLPGTEGMDARLAHQLPGKPAEGQTPLINHHSSSSSDLRMRRITGARGKSVDIY